MRPATDERKMLSLITTTGPAPHNKTRKLGQKFINSQACTTTYTHLLNLTINRASNVAHTRAHPLLRNRFKGHVMGRLVPWLLSQRGNGQGLVSRAVKTVLCNAAVLPIISTLCYCPWLCKNSQNKLPRFSYSEIQYSLFSACGDLPCPHWVSMYLFICLLLVRVMGLRTSHTRQVLLY